MKIICGLGNPGPHYEMTRHNVGFLALDHLAEIWQAEGPTRKPDAEYFNATVAGEKVVLVKPQTYMNESGRAIAPLFKFFKCAPGDLIVIHDELDLMPATMRIKTGGGTGGHNGLKSLDAHLGSGLTNYHRIRLGIGHPSKLNLPISPVDYVLQQFTDEELASLGEVFDRVGVATERMIRGDVSGAMTEFN